MVLVAGGLWGVLMDAAEIRRVTYEVAAEIADYAKRREFTSDRIVLAGIWRPGFTWAVRLLDYLTPLVGRGIRMITLDVTHVYGGHRTPYARARSGGLRTDFSGCLVVVVDDVIDGGFTYVVAMSELQETTPGEVRAAILAATRKRVLADIHPLWVGKLLDDLPADSDITTEFVEDGFERDCMTAGPVAEKHEARTDFPSVTRIRQLEQAARNSAKDGEVFSGMTPDALRALDLLAEGKHPDAIAEYIGFGRDTVYGWFRKARDELILETNHQLVARYVAWRMWRNLLA